MSEASADASRRRRTSDALLSRKRQRFSRLFIAQIRNGIKITGATYATTEIMQTTTRERNVIASS